MAILITWIREALDLPYSTDRRVPLRVWVNSALAFIQNEETYELELTTTWMHSLRDDVKEELTKVMVDVNKHLHMLRDDPTL